MSSTLSRGSSSPHNITPSPYSRVNVSSSSSRARASRSYSKNREPNEPLREPKVDEVVPAEFSFTKDSEAIRKQLSSMTSHDRADLYPTQITEGLVSLMRRDCYWKSGLPVLVPNENQRITSYKTGYSFVYTYPFTLGFKLPIDPAIVEFCRFFNVCLGHIGPLIWSQ